MATLDVFCGKCGERMTPENARLRPELFLHDACLPDELRPAAVPAIPPPTGHAPLPWKVVPSDKAPGYRLRGADDYPICFVAATPSLTGDRDRADVELIVLAVNGRDELIRRLAAAKADLDRLRAVVEAAYQGPRWATGDTVDDWRERLQRSAEAALTAAHHNRRA